MPFTLGIDYGTQSGRVILLDLNTGAELAVSVVPYRHGVIDETLPSTGERLPLDWALQHPQDYIEVLQQGIPDVIKQSGIDANEIIGLGVDFTSCTVLPVTEDGTPLCMLSQWATKRHAWPKLWKHHSAQRIADRINETAERRGEIFLTRYGGRVSSEWYFPKLIEVFEEDREVYDACFKFVEAADWIVWYLTGAERRNSCTAGYKAMWSQDEGLPSDPFFTEVSPEFTNPKEKLGETFYPLGTQAGTLREEVARELGLSSRAAVAVGNVDAMVSAPSVGVSEPGSLIMVMGTSICHLAITEQEVRLPGITGVVKDGVIPGFYGYEAGQAAVGDMFEWFVDKAIPKEYLEKAKSEQLSIYEYLEKLAARQIPGQNGLISLDWWNGNRSILGDADLSGVVIGLSLATSPEEIYRSLLESTAFGTRRIVDNFLEHGVELRELVACGGIAQKSPLLMQIYADVCGMPVVVRSSTEVPARGSAMYGAVAAGEHIGGFASINEAIKQLAAPIQKIYYPIQENHTRYTALYDIYREIYDFFGKDRVELLHRLKELRLNTFQL